MSTARWPKVSTTRPHRVAPGLYTLRGHTLRRESRFGGPWGSWAVYDGTVMVDWARTLAEAVELVPVPVRCVGREGGPTANPIATPRAGAGRAFGNQDRLLSPAEKLRAPRYGRGEITGCPW